MGQGMLRTTLGALAAALFAAGFVAAPQALAQGDPTECLAADPPPVTRPAAPLRFGITPQLAGHVGAEQGEAVPLDPRRTRKALTRLRPAKRELVLHLNRLFFSDRRAGIRRFARRVDRYARAGFRSEIQVRYHPTPAQEGDMHAWTRFVKRAVRKLGRKRSVVAFTITNEANLPISPNTSDGAYRGVVRALVRGVVVADRQLRRMGRPRVPVGFSVMWRWLPADLQFWDRVDAAATPRFRRALDYVGVQAYPGLVWPPGPLPPDGAGAELVDALTLLRSCFMPRAGLGRRYELWVSENGYATRPTVDTEQAQEASLDASVRWVHRYSRTLNVTDYRYFNLRDNSATGTDLFDQVGLLRDDYSPKPAFAAYRRLIRRFGE